MKTITLLDFCKENHIPTVAYSANPETLERWKGNNMVAVGGGYAYVEPDGREEYAQFVSGEFTHSTVHYHSIDFNIMFLVGRISKVFNTGTFRLYFYVTKTGQCLISGVD